MDLVRVVEENIGEVVIAVFVRERVPLTARGRSVGGMLAGDLRVEDGRAGCCIRDLAVDRSPTQVAREGEGSCACERGDDGGRGIACGWNGRGQNFAEVAGGDQQYGKKE